MDINKKHRTNSLQAPAAPSRHPSHHAPRRSASLKTSLNYNSDPPRPAPLVRVKGRTAMNSSPPKTSEMTWANDTSPRKGTSGRPGTPGTPGTPRRAGTPEVGASSFVHPSSALLQDLLKEQRASRGTRGPADDTDGLVPQTPDRQSRTRSQSQSQSQEDSTSEKQRKANSALSAGLRQPREMGVREMDQYVSKMNKQNFDLKLEIFHRAQQVTTLESRLERLQELEEEVKRMRGLEDELQELRHAEEDNQRLRESNEQLRQELDKRDQAVTEAVELICELEAKVDHLEAERNVSRPSTSRSNATSDGPDAATPKQRTNINVSQRAPSRRVPMSDQHRNAPSERHLQSAPSFLRDENKNTAALRSFHIPSGDQSQSAMSVITKSESLNSMNDTTEPESPRLSALSECSDLLPEDVSVVRNGFDKSDYASHETATASSDTLGLQHVQQQQESKREHIDQWIQPLPEMFPANSISPSKRKNRATMYEFNNSTPDADSNPNDPRQRIRLDGFFGSRLPPTPDTMSTAYRPNRSNGSLKAGQRQRMGWPRSFDDLTRRDSGNSGKADSVETNLSDTSRGNLRNNEVDGGPVVAPFNAIPTTHRRRASCQERPAAWPDLDHHEGSNGYYDNNTKRHTLDVTSPSPPLSPQEWVEAANSNPRSTEEDYRRTNSHSYNPSIPGQISPHGRRYSMDVSSQKSKPAEPTLDLRSLEAAPKPVLRAAQAPSSAMTSRRRISFIPPFLSRLASTRRQLSPLVVDGAPAPVIPKTRNMSTTPNGDGENPSPNGAESRPALPTYADPRNNQLVRRTLPHAYTENNASPNGATPRPATAQNKEHKRRSSFGIFGWMKEASGIGSHGKKSEPSSPVTPTQLTNGMKSRRGSIRVTPDGAGTVSKTSSTNGVTDASSSKSDANTEVSLKQMLREEEEPIRRPRYVERRRGNAL